MSKKYETRDDTKRTHMVTVRFSDDEMDILNIICEALDQTKSQYIRRRALTATLPQPIVQLALDEKSMKRLTGQFGKIGSNLNQIARKLNSGESADSKLRDDIGDCVSDMNEMLKLLRSVEGYCGDLETPERT
ncbi:MAG: MobC family plasmid mobilization relaxosome protein [Oscillospiraceae bacterium]|nr:MobC family plasmid mobilization relaxosome protein [Oscillospiraceae bacterium]